MLPTGFNFTTYNSYQTTSNNGGYKISGSTTYDPSFTITTNPNLKPDEWFIIPGPSPTVDFGPPLMAPKEAMELLDKTLKRLAEIEEEKEVKRPGRLIEVEEEI